MKLLFAILLVPLIAVLPPAVALSSCAAVTTMADPGAGVYVIASTSDPKIWTEQNGYPGLQQVACTDAAGGVHDADFRNFSFHIPQESELPCHLSGRTLQCT